MRIDLMRIAAVAVLIFTLMSPALSAELAPDWRLATANGDSVRLSQEVKEQPVIVFFWATWCPYCKALMPHIQSMRLEYGEDIKILALTINDKKGDPVAFIEDAGYDFTVLPDGDGVAELYEIHGTPGVILVDGDMKMRFDLRELPAYDPPPSGEKISHGKKAAYKAPYWAAAMRKAIDAVLDEEM
jgi:thiol-disulfide isomerase/thioredoxin